MNLNASPNTVRAITQVFSLASVLDDRVAQPDRHRVAAWAEQVERHKLTENDLLDGVQAYYDRPSERAMQVGDLIHHARIVKRDRLDKEEDAARDERRATHDHKAADELSLRLVGGTDLGPTKNRTNRLIKAEIALQCATGKNEAQHAIREFLAAKKEAKDSGKKANGQAAS